MFRCIHTADWHLGQSFHGFDRNIEHAAFLSWLLNTVKTRQPDALIVAGDIFDTINPSSGSLRQYFEFLAQLRKSAPELQVVVTAGNHDSGSRLEAPSDLLQALNINVVGTVPRGDDGTVQPERLVIPLYRSVGQTTVDGQPSLFPLEEESLQAVVIAMPFLRPADVPRVPDAADAYLDGIAELYRQAGEVAEQHRSDNEVPIIAMGHCHFTDGHESPDSERRLVVGNAEALKANSFPQTADYVALGHLHKAQTFDGGRIRYSGSPIPLSFSERKYEHAITELCFEGQTLVAAEAITVPVTIPLLTVPPKPATLSEVLQQLNNLPKDSEGDQDTRPYLEVRILDDGPDPTRRKKVEDAIADRHVRLASIKLQAAATEEGASDTDDLVRTIDDLQRLDPEQLFTAAWHDTYNTDPTPQVQNALREILEATESD